MPPVIIDKNETVCGTYYNNLRVGGRYKYMNTPMGAFYCQELFETVRAEDLPDMILVHADSTIGCLPSNLPLNRPKILLIGDTHHLESPIQKMIEYAAKEKFDAVLLWNRQHAHFFKELGFTNVFWMPGLTFAIPPTPQPASRTDELCFFGQLGSQHPMRTRIVKAVLDAGIEITGGKRTRPESLQLVSKSRSSLNVSLNGEFNLRVFESTQNGALLFSDKLSAYAGLQLFYRDGESLVTYSNAKSLIEKINYYHSHREATDRIAAEGCNITNRLFNFDARREAFFSLLNNGETLDEFRLKDEPRCRVESASDENKKATLRRVQIYEVAQELHRRIESPHIILTARVTPFVASDLADLARLHQHLAVDEETFDRTIQPLLQKLQVNNLSRIDPESLASHSSHLLIATEKEIESLLPTLKKNHTSLCILDFSEDREPRHARILALGYEDASEKIPGLFKLRK